ncbi:endonuclease exonuclease phosphatase family protein [Diplodia corticola]|uniref:Endonuclease exonuclease phosphatase family protein n=1 Tax=Diplodia corticola TaxID=236234 RepID=A0A1J9R7Y2_9PEZI|nr:endonuclease exonuclease phosphatase family protein [Diplodia corticola]OJD36704.1 endonuclease exonuclease phosphatase family protein [Diplodia corticola]
MAPARSIALVASAAIPAAMAATSGSLTALAMNVAGLPAILQGNDVPGDKTTNTASIGTKFSELGYDIIHVQEDFNYHATLYEYDTHPYRTATSGGVPFGSGLNTLSNFDWIDFERIKWATCSSASGADCLTPKGFTFMRAKVDEGVWIDVYNLHTDAGIEDDDEAARTANVKQVADHIDAYSAGNAVLVFGDTNSRYTRVADNIALFTTQNGLTDAWVELEHAGTPPSEELLCANPSTTDACETVDKLFYRGSRLLSLSATDFSYASPDFLQANGSILSDHNPILVSLDWSVADASLRQSGYWGGPHGTWFNDAATGGALPAAPPPAGATLTLAGANRLDSIALNLTDGTALAHGGAGGTPQSLVLESGESVNGLKLCQDKYENHTRIFYAQASTTSGRTVAAGTETSDCVTYEAPSGFGLVGFAGRAGDEVDQLAAVWGKL